MRQQRNSRPQSGNSCTSPKSRGSRPWGPCSESSCPPAGPLLESGFGGRGSGGRVRRAQILAGIRCCTRLSAAPDRDRAARGAVAVAVAVIARSLSAASPPAAPATSEGGSPMAKPAPVARGAPAPRLTGGAPQAGWKEPTSRPGRSRRGPLEGASAHVPGPGPARPARRLRAPWGGHCQDAGGTRRARATARGATLYPSSPPQRLGLPTLTPGIGTAPQPEVCPGSRAARRSWNAPGTGRQCPRRRQLAS